MNSKTINFDQTGTISSSNIALEGRLSNAPKKSLCRKGGMDEMKFESFKKMYSDFIHVIARLNLKLLLWHEEVQKELIPYVDQLFNADVELKEAISRFINSYLLIFSVDEYAEAVLHRLGIYIYFKSKICLKNHRKDLTYTLIQLMLNHGFQEKTCNR